MDLITQKQHVEVNRLMIDNKALTKSKLLNIPITPFPDALSLLIYNEVSVIARFPFELYAEAATKRDKLLGTNTSKPSLAIIENYSAYELAGVVLYDSKLNALSQSWFIAGEFDTDRQAQLVLMHNRLSDAIDALDTMDTLQSDLLIRKMANLNELSVKGEDAFQKYLFVCEVIEAIESVSEFTILRRSKRRQSKVMKTVAESEAWLDNLDLTLPVAQHYDLLWNSPINPDWLERFLNAPFSQQNWSETKKWLSGNLYMQASSTLGEIKQEEKAYKGAMQRFHSAPVITL